MELKFFLAIGDGLRVVSLFQFGEAAIEPEAALLGIDVFDLLEEVERIWYLVRDNV